MRQQLIVFAQVIKFVKIKLKGGRVNPNGYALIQLHSCACTVI